MMITVEQMFADVEQMLRKAAEDNELDYEQFVARVAAAYAAADAAFYKF